MELQDRADTDLGECRYCDLLVLVGESQSEGDVEQNLSDDEDIGDTEPDHIHSSGAPRGPKVHGGTRSTTRSFC